MRIKSLVVPCSDFNSCDCEKKKLGKIVYMLRQRLGKKVFGRRKSWERVSTCEDESWEIVSTSTYF